VPPRDEFLVASGARQVQGAAKRTLLIIPDDENITESVMCILNRHSGARAARTRNLEIPVCPADHPGMTRAII